MKNIFLKSASLLLILLSQSGISSAQQATLKGVVTDEATGETLIGVNVVIEGTTIGAATDMDGRYSFHVDPGTYTISATYIGYQPARIPEVKLSAGETRQLDVKLKDGSIEFKEFVVEARQIKNNENAVLGMQRKSAGIQDGISAQEMKRSGASNAAESAQRVTGVSIIDGKHLMVRGLGDRYTYTQLNGVTLQSPDPYKNSAQLDLIPSNLLDNIITAKTSTPDQPGTFTGGIVNLTTKSYPDKFTLQFSSSISFNPNASFNPDFLTHQGGETDWLGFDDGGRKLPSILQDESLRKRLTSAFYIKARNNRDTAQLLSEASRSLNPVMTPSRKTSFTNSSYSFSAGNQHKLFGRKIGYIFGINFRTQYSFYDNGISSSYEAAGKGSETLNERFALSDALGVENPQMNGLFSLNYQVAKNHEIGGTVIYNKDTEKSSRYLVGRALGFTSREAPFESRVLSFKERSLVTWQGNGRHTFPSLNKMQISWTGGYTTTAMEEPDLRVFANELVDDTIYQINASTYNLPTHFFRSLRDTLLEGKIDMTIPFGKQETNMLKAGVMANRKTRSFTEDNFYLRLAPRYQGLSGQPYNGDAEEFFGPGNTGFIDTTANGRNVIGNYVVDGSDPKNNYTGFEEVKAAYLLATLALSNRLKATGGIRAEHTSMEVSSADSSGSFCWDLNNNQIGDPEEDTNQDGRYNVLDCGSYGTINSLDFLPSVNLTFALNDAMNLRASWSKTLARPTMRELAPFASFDFIGGFIYVGNPELKRSIIYNYDLRWEYYGNPGEMMAVSAFYKEFNDPVVKIFNPKTSNPEIYFANTDKAVVYGWEAEIRKSLSFIHPGVKNFRMQANFSYIVSAVDLDTAEFRNASELNPEIQKSRPFAGQSPYLFNGGLTYRADSARLEAGIFINIFGDRLSEIGQNGLPDAYEKGRHDLQINISKQFGKHLSVKLAGSNLLNAPYQKTQTYKDKVYYLSSYRTGPTFTFTLGWAI